MWPLPVVLCIVPCLFLSKVNHSLYRFPPRCGSILGAYWYTNVGNACSFLFGTIHGSFCSQRWYITCLKKWAAFRLPVDSLVYSEIICLFPWTLSESCRHIYDLKFCVPLLVQEMYQNKPKSGTFSAPEKFNPDLVQSVAHSAPKDGTLPA